jgi:hypothetical protein
VGRVRCARVPRDGPGRRHCAPARGVGPRGTGAALLGSRRASRRQALEHLHDVGRRRAAVSDALAQRLWVRGCARGRGGAGAARRRCRVCAAGVSGVLG